MDRKSVAPGYIPIVQPDFKGFSLPEFRERAQRFFASAAAGSMELDPVFKNGKSTLAGISGDLFVKQYKCRSFFYALRHLFLTKRTSLVLQGALLLKEQNIPTPQVLAVCDFKKHGIAAGGMLLTALMPPDTVWCQAELSKLTPETCESFAAGLAGLLAGLHRGGLEHGDLNLRNIFCTFRDGRYGDFGVIDLDSCRIASRPLPVNVRRREMARLLSSISKSIWYEKLDIPDMKPSILEHYRQLSGWDLNDAGLEKRIRYLTTRIKKGR